MDASPLEDRLAFTVVEVAKISASSRTSIYKEIKEGRLTSSKIGSRTIIRRDDLDAWLGSL